ncbi:MAG: hypothetical protein J6P71_02785, partial [Oscillospiraceae bacterium]|nr:hypothetical protein [Oscillospiraceae bacterium]
MGISTLKKQIKDFILTECHQEKVGVASIERFNSAPKGMHPTDFLPGCKSVIMFCTRLPDGAVNSALRTYEDRNFDVHGQYGMFGYVGVPNYNLLWASYKAARFIEKNSDAVAMPMTAGPTHGAPML